MPFGASILLMVYMILIKNKNKNKYSYLWAHWKLEGRIIS